MSDPTVFRDGYTRDLRVNAKKGLHGKLEGEFRPCLVAERDRMQSIAQKGDADKTNAAAIKLLLDKIVSWDATYEDESGLSKAAPVNAYWLSHLAPALFDSIYWIVLGVRSSDPADPSPDATSSEDRDYLDQIARGEKGASDEGN
jgi:hypothetical protein